jgi:aminoglycoside 2'-N-acetyltransferase I
MPPDILASIRRLNEEAHGHPFVEDWDHALGGLHFFIEEDGEPVSHASVVERRLETSATSLRTGYVEAVATLPDRQRRGHMTLIMKAVTDHIRGEYELGGLCTGDNGFYERFGWETWRGPTFVRTENGLERTTHEDGNVMILRRPSTPGIELAAPISCEWRPGDVW